MKRFKPSAKPCVNCRKIKSAHKRVLGVLLCPKLLSRRFTYTMLAEVIYTPMTYGVSEIANPDALEKLAADNGILSTKYDALNLGVPLPQEAHNGSN